MNKTWLIKRHQEIGQNKTKSRAGRPKATRTEDNYIRVTSLWDRRLIAPNITAQLNQNHEKKMSQQPLWREESVKLAYMAELLSRNHCWGSKTMSKGSSDTRYSKAGQKSSRIKPFGLTNQSLKSFGEIGESMCSEELMKELWPPLLHQLQSMEEAQLWCWRICTRWRANWIRLAIIADCNITWSYLESGLWVEDLYSYKIITQSILVNSAWSKEE